MGTGLDDAQYKLDKARDSASANLRENKRLRAKLERVKKDRQDKHDQLRDCWWRLEANEGRLQASQKQRDNELADILELIAGPSAGLPSPNWRWFIDERHR